MKMSRRPGQGSLIVLVLGLFIWRCACQSECGTTPGITVTPSTNQTVPINTDTNITYRCQVTNGRRADWTFMDIQIPIGSPDDTSLEQLGVVISAGSSMSDIYLTVDRTGRQNFVNRDLKIVCTALTTTPVLMINEGCEYFIRTFDVPEPPPNLDFNPLPTNLSVLVISWDQPDNTLIDEDDPVTTTYTVTVTGPTFNFSETTTDTRYSFVDDIDQPCAMHNFQVHASNAAGDGTPDVINETIPISPDIDALSADLRVSRVFVTSPTTVSVEATFSRALACSLNFPLDSYILHTMTVVSTKFSANDSRIVGRETIALNMTSSKVLPNMVYSLSVAACISVTCRESSAVSFMTTDVQSANITFYESNIFLSCLFAVGSTARGCVFVFTVSPNITEEFTVARTDGALCNEILNMENVYTSVETLDWESDGSYGNVPVIPARMRVETGEEYMEATGCILPTQVVVTEIVGLSAGAITGIVMAILFVLVVAVVVVIVIVIVAMRSTKQANVAEVCVDCAPESGSLLVGRDSPDAAPKPLDDSQAGGPPDPCSKLARVREGVQEKLTFQLKPGRKNGELVVNRTMLHRLTEMMGTNSDEVKYTFLVPEK